MRITLSLSPNKSVEEVSIKPSLVLDLEGFPEVPKTKQESFSVAGSSVEKNKFHFQFKVHSLTRDHQGVLFRFKFEASVGESEICRVFSEPLNIISKASKKRELSPEVKREKSPLSSTHQSESLEEAPKKKAKAKQMEEISGGLDLIQQKICAITQSLQDPLTGFVSRYCNSTAEQRREMAASFSSRFPSADIAREFLGNMSLSLNPPLSSSMSLSANSFGALEPLFEEIQPKSETFCSPLTFEFFERN